MQKAEQCPLTSKAVHNQQIFEEYLQYDLESNGKLFTLRWPIAEDVWVEKLNIKKDEQIVFQAMLFNNEWPIEKETLITKELISQILRLGEYPRKFDEKMNYYLLKSYENGGSEYKSIEVDPENFFESYSKDFDEYSRIINGLKSKELISTKQNKLSDFILTEKGIELGVRLQ